MKVALQHFRVFKACFWGNLRSKFANFWWPKNASFCRNKRFLAERRIAIAQRSPPSMEGGDLWSTKKNAYFCRTEPQLFCMSFFPVFLGQVEVQFGWILVAKKRFFLQKGGQHSSKVTTFQGRWWPLSYAKNAYFCRTEHDIAQRSPPT